MIRKILLLATICLGLTAGKALAAEPFNSEKYDTLLLKPGTEAADFRYSSDGKTLSKLRGKLVVLDFWASWCPDCRKDVPRIKALYEKYAPKGVEFIGISFDTNKDAWQNFVKKNDMKWTQFSELKRWKKETNIDALYKIDWIPTTYLIGRDGKVILGTIDLDKLDKALEAATR